MSEYTDQIFKYYRNPDPQTAALLEHGAELFRKGTLRYELPIDCGATIKFRQISHEFDFGCNGFMLGQFDSPEANLAYETAFKKLFNLMVIPFYWGSIEPEKGSPRYDKNSPRVYRRPPPDLLLEFCEKNNIRPKGHVLLYDGHNPDWLRRATSAELKRIYERRVREIAERYGDRIFNWDVSNEVLYKQASGQVPEDFAHFSYDIAAKYFPVSTRLNYNDGNAWRDHNGYYCPENLLVGWLKSSGRRVDAIGLQLHMMGSAKPKDFLPWWGEYYFNPEHLRTIIDNFAKLGTPVTISEITLTAHKELGDERFEFQRECTDFLYRFWFSHQAINGIIWWNLVDGTAQGSENDAEGGLLGRDFKAKPAFDCLDNLINHEWRTSGEMRYDPTKKNYIRGYFGNYEITIDADDGRHFVVNEPIVSGRANVAKIKLC